MKYIIKFTDVNDTFHVPWDMIVEDTKHEGVLTVQEPDPNAGANLLGFEVEPQECEVFIPKNPDWKEQAIGKHPVFAHPGGMFSLRGFIVREVIEK